MTKKLLKYHNVKNIRELKQKIPDLKNLKAKEIYQLLKIAIPQIEKNLAINENKKFLTKIQNVKHLRKINEFTEKMANKKIGSFLKKTLVKRRYLIHATIRRTYKKSGKEFILQETKGPFNDNINSHLNELNIDNDYQTDTVVDYKIEYMNEEKYKRYIKRQKYSFDA